MESFAVARRSRSHSSSLGIHGSLCIRLIGPAVRKTAVPQQRNAPPRETGFPGRRPSSTKYSKNNRRAVTLWIRVELASPLARDSLIQPATSDCVLASVVVPGFDKRKVRIDGTSVCVERVRSQAKLLSHGQPSTGMNGSGKVIVTIKIESKRHDTCVCAFQIALARLGMRSLFTP